jgi:hypothetical protein
MTAIMARRPFAVSSRNLRVFAAGFQKPTAPARREHADDRRHGQAAAPISSQNLLVFEAGSQKPTGARPQGTCR